VHELNDEIRDKEIRLIGSEGEQLGIMAPFDALRIADEQGLDLVKSLPRQSRPCAS
jgi:translation initiation factor IF-3